MNNLETEIKQLIINALNLEGVKPEDIVTADPLFGEGLGLDSIDALEIGIALKKAYDIQIQTQDESVKQHFYSVETLANFIKAQKGL